MHVFISYRRSDTQGPASRLAEALRSKLPEATIFLDTEEPTPGSFPARIARELKAANVMLALIGRQWLAGDGDTGAPTADDNDWVRREIKTAFETGVTVIPVLVDEAPMPRREQLPPLMDALADQEAAALRTKVNRDWNSDVDEIVRQLRVATPPERPPETEHQPYVLAIYAALVRWSIYEAELGWRVTSALLPVVTVLAAIGALPSVLERASRNLWIAALVASAMGLLFAVLWHSMVARTRLFFKYRVDSANSIELAFPVTPECAHLFRTKLYRGWWELNDGKGNGPQIYQFSFLQRITMTTALHLITTSYIILLLVLLALNLVQTIRAN